uniref:Uncharacterized protein n=1 Tax=Anguilla anguilla TaxID=7936 RepID=A0A0E9WQI1_ANGAN
MYRQTKKKCLRYWIKKRKYSTCEQKEHPCLCTAVRKKNRYNFHISSWCTYIMASSEISRKVYPNVLLTAGLFSSEKSSSEGIKSFMFPQKLSLSTFSDKGIPSIGSGGIRKKIET